MSLRADLDDLAELSVPVDLHDRVLAASKRARARTATVMAGAASLILMAVAGLVVLLPGGAAPTGSHGDQPTTVPTGTITNDDPAFAPYDGGPLAHATLDVPAWPGDADCPSGTITFIKNGVGLVPDRPDATIEIVKVVAVAAPADDSTEYVALLRCVVSGATTLYADQVLGVLSPPGDNPIRTLGQVVTSGAGGIAGVFDVAFDNGMIRVDVGDRTGVHVATALRQLRYFRWDGEAYQQVGGATSFPDHPPAIALTISSTHTASAVEDGRQSVDVRIVVANAGSIASPPLRLVFAVAATTMTAGTGWAGCVRDLSNLTEGQVLLGCLLRSAPAGGAAVADYQLLVPADSNEAQSVLVVVQQTSPRALERDLVDNQATIVVLSPP